MKRFIYIAVFLVLSGCKTEKTSLKKQGLKQPKLKFLNEFVVKDSLNFNNTIIGGISGIDFSNNQYYMVVDDAKNPRVLIGDVVIKKDSIKNVIFQKVISLQPDSDFYQNNVLDLESVFFNDNKLNLVSEGSIRKGKNPTIFTIDTAGNFKEEIKIPDYFKANSQAKPKHNAAFESSSKSFDKKGFWVAMEAPLQADGDEPTFHKTPSPIRITYFDTQTKTATKQFSYQLEKIDKPAKGSVNLNGVTAILEYKKNQFFVVERIYQSGYGAYGNTIRVFKATVNENVNKSFNENTTNTLEIPALKKEKYIPLKKELLFDFKSIQPKLTNSIIDNIEGITLGPKLSNGNNSLIFVSDDNFQVYGKQLTQFLLFEIETEKVH
ncbi:esterase-like activity of phytase family protein [Tenacibaculum finnmarkense genomovar finnmarkense]|uniref:esterase-like activity of phytase family protein n=1 Tax=Tenacibaculum finnmarkense TaxID=2781243 RepID=UPI000C559D7B|nr:esterase-like activity of phytase family protein [Tenacibaculum finnmarkense]MBE7661237.1 esterase-like activity of phytase family protein [Tenacibaculum finnmarkense genomovar finnmarkense]MCD8418428.1 esterase-like activity of phytase family protein [Tenacibaculum finnmarkense genomovar finnmarkense]MCD8440630.1 esterase-like activity of phytase family protein [Tenacibaculum finnmarkense genomovar ulcerans]MCG8186736.1 esterase-like activity of phytase family protein [Tenacibaculum finnmar